MNTTKWLLRFLTASALGLVQGSVSAGSTAVVSGSGIAIVSSSGMATGDELVVGKGPVTSETRKPSAYSELLIEAPVEMRYSVGSTASLKISAPANILPLVTTEVKGRRLVVGLSKPVSMSGAIRIEATGPSPEKTVVSGSGELRMTGLTGRTCALEVSGAATVTLAGQVDQAVLEITGSADVDAGQLRSLDARIDVSGSGDLSAYASRSAKVKLSGSGDITVAGKPGQRSVERSGAGEVSFK